MKNIIVLFFFVIVGICSRAQQQSPFPASVQVEKTAALQRIKNTKFFVQLPENYRPGQIQMRIERDAQTFLQVVELPGISFKEEKETISKSLIENDIMKLRIQPLKYNNYDAFYFSGSSAKTGEATLGIAFGDEYLTVIISGVYQANDKEAMNELHRMLSASYYDALFEVDPLERFKLTLDLEITGFKVAADRGVSLVYTLNGIADEGKEESISSIKIYSMKAADFPEAKEQLEYILDSDNWSKVLQSEEKETVINGNRAYTLLKKLDFGDQVLVTMYYVVMHKGNNSFIYIATDYDNGKWLEQFRKTAERIQLQ